MVFTLLLVGCIAVNAYATSGFDGKTQQGLESEAMVYRLFSKQYTVYGKNGVDITDAFYAALTSEYENKNYSAILTYLQQHVSYAEATETVITPIAPINSKSVLRSTRTIIVKNTLYKTNA